MAITIDGSTVKSGSTIDGAAIKQITVDGQVVWNSELVVYDHGTEYTPVTISVDASNHGKVLRNADNIYVDSMDYVGSFAECQFTGVDLSLYNRMEVYFYAELSEDSYVSAYFNMIPGPSLSSDGILDYTITPLIVDISANTGTSITFRCEGDHDSDSSGCDIIYYDASADCRIYKIRLYNV
jgi:hypothetical protein